MKLKITRLSSNANLATFSIDADSWEHWSNMGINKEQFYQNCSISQTDFCLQTFELEIESVWNFDL